MEVESGAGVVLDAIQREVDRSFAESINYDQLLDVLVQIPVSRAVLPRPLHEEAIWPSVHRRALIAQLHGGAEHYKFQAMSGLIFGPFFDQIRNMAEQEHALAITE